MNSNLGNTPSTSFSVLLKCHYSLVPFLLIGIAVISLSFIRVTPFFFDDPLYTKR
jgi:hypothetical protein